MTVGDATVAEAAGPALRRCISIDRPTFAAEHWSRTPLLTGHAALGRDFTDLLDPDAVDELLSRRGLRTPFLRMAKDGSVLPAGRFTRGGGAGAGAADQVADDLVLAEVGDGATLVLQGLHRTWPPLVEFAADLAAELGHPVQINAYITPPENRGFAPHYDVHDVFVLQVSGRKQWRIHEPVVLDPLPDQPWDQHRAAVAARAVERPMIDAVLEPGDALYLPRGYLHAADALGETSIHLTVGVHPVTRQRLVTELVARARDDPALRTSLPMGVDLGDPHVLAPHLAATVAALAAQLASATGPAAVAAVAQAVADELTAQTRPVPLGPLAQLAAAAALEPDTPLRMRRGLRCGTERRDAGLRLRLLGRTLDLPAAAENAVKAVLAGQVLTPASLPGLPADEQLELARRLLRAGVLVPA
jgi:bifunctional lysine-specific demethylase and histidyl-hydroxylase NO66